MYPSTNKMDPTHPYAAPEFEVRVARFANNSVNSVSVTPIRRPGRYYNILQVMDDISRTLHAAIIDALRPMTNNQISRLVGNLQMNNIHNTMHTHLERVRVTEINTALVHQIFDTATHAESNPDLTLEDVEWTFYILPGITVARKCKPTAGMAKLTTKPYPCFGIPEQGCMAIACAYSLIMHGERGQTARQQTKDNRVKHMNKFAQELSVELAWDKEMPITAVFDLLDLYPAYRIAILSKSLHYPIYVRQGPEYINKTIYLGTTLDDGNDHMFAITSPQEFLQARGSLIFCEPCCHVHNRAQGCPDSEPRPLTRVDCSKCGLNYIKSSSTQHWCNANQCRFCSLLLESSAILTHRCPLFATMKKVPGKFIGDQFHDNEPEENESRRDPERMLWAYDFESANVETGRNIPSYKVNPVTKLFEPNAYGDIEIVEINQTKQVPNLVTYWNVFNETQVRHTTDITQFLREMLSINYGKNTVYAHNASGYDTKLIFDHLSHFNPELMADVNPIVRGTKIMRLAIGDTHFCDSMLHLPGSLSGLADNYLKGTEHNLAKTYFPHAFNKPENQDYIGPQRPIAEYDNRYAIKTKKDQEDFDRAMELRPPIFDMKKDMIEYGINDTKMLGSILKIHNANITSILASINPDAAFSPWHSTTVAGYIHKAILMDQKVTHAIDPKTPLTLEQINEISSNTWVALQSEEHYFAKQALRGGRTEVRKFYHKGPVKCVDVHSMYPSVQMGKSITVMGKKIPLLYPVGPPRIEVFDTAYTPCHLHAQDMNKCFCQTRRRNPKLNVYVKPHPTDIHGFIQNFNGIICIDATPPNIFHPLLPVFQDNKCVFSCEPIVCKTYLSPMLKVAIDNGYIVTKIYRADHYKLSPSLWSHILAPFYLEKYYYSKDSYPPDQATINEHKASTNFGFTIDHSKCSKQPARKTSAKILINSAWGKLAESVDHTQSKILSYNRTDESMRFYKDLEDGHAKVRQINSITNDLNLYKYDELRSKVDPVLNKGNIAVAAFVPMYGQLLLWNELNQLGDRVIMCDTDSVKYYDNGIPGEYQTPLGHFLGDWEDEGTLTEFVSIGLKSYCLRYESKPEAIRLKGLCLKYSHSGIINFEVMKEILTYDDSAFIPQQSFDYKFGHGITIREYLKQVKFDQYILKGDYDRETFTLYPYGYNKN